MEREGKKRRLEGEELSSGARDIHSKRNHMKLAAHRHQHDAAHRPGHCVDNEDGGQGREEWRKKADRKRQRKLEREKRKALRKGLADESFSVDRAAPIRLDSEDSAKAGAVCRGGGESHAAAGRAETGKKKGKRRRPAEQDREGKCPQVAESRRERTDDETRHECSDNGAAQGEFPFAVSAEADHAETPLQAYADIASVLRIVAENLGKDARDLKIYDPYFCAGTMKEHMRAVGFPCVYNRKEDFYQVVKNGAVPEHDVVVTNPPYSLDHVQRIIRWLVRNGKPWFLLVPNYVYMKVCSALYVCLSCGLCIASRARVHPHLLSFLSFPLPPPAPFSPCLSPCLALTLAIPRHETQPHAGLLPGGARGEPKSSHVPHSARSLHLPSAAKGHRRPRQNAQSRRTQNCSLPQLLVP